MYNAGVAGLLLSSSGTVSLIVVIVLLLHRLIEYVSDEKQASASQLSLIQRFTKTFRKQVEGRKERRMSSSRCQAKRGADP